MNNKKGTNDPRLHLEGAPVLTWAAVSSKAQDRYSVDDQLKLARDWCSKHGCKIVEELVVRGFSRDYWTLADVVAASGRDPDMEAFAKLQAHIRKKTFTIFLCFDADRFGRTQSLVHEVIGRITRDCEALIYTLFDGVWMDEESAPMIGTLKAYKAQQDVTRLKDYRVVGMDNRARDGKSTSAVLPMFHKRVRDEHGRETGVIVDESQRQLWTDVATLILRGVSWGSMEKVLFEEFGHGKDGKSLAHHHVRRLVVSYSFWGHAALNYDVKDKQSVEQRGPWIWDEHIPAPPPVTVYRNRLPAVYSGEWAQLGEQIKAELWRRYQLLGRARPYATYRFHGLLVCAECGFTLNKLTVTKYPDRHYLRCASRFGSKHRQLAFTCSQSQNLRSEIVQDYFTVQLQNRLDQLPSILFNQLNDTDALQRQLDDLDRQIARLQKRNDVLISELGDSPDQARAGYRKKIADTSSEIERAQQAKAQIEGEVANQTDTEEQQRQFVEELKEHGVGWLWTLPDTAIHQRLLAALGGYQLTVRDGKINGRVPTMFHQVRPKRPLES